MLTLIDVQTPVLIYAAYRGFRLLLWLSFCTWIDHHDKEHAEKVIKAARPRFALSLPPAWRPPAKGG